MAYGSVRGWVEFGRWWMVLIGIGVSALASCRRGDANLLLNGMSVAGAGFFASVLRQRGKRLTEDRNSAKDADVTGKPSEKDGQPLLFDDFRTPGTPVVRSPEEESSVTPSTRHAQPAPDDRQNNPLRDAQIVDFFDLDLGESGERSEPRQEFHGLLDRLILVLKDALFAHTVAFFWNNRERETIVLEAMASDTSAFMTGRKLNAESDLLSQVASTGKPQLVNTISPAAELDLLRFYTEPVGVRSAVAVPVFFRSGTEDVQSIGVLVADSKAEDAFGPETILLLGRCTKLISSLVKSYTEKYDLVNDSELLSSIRRMQDRLRSDQSEGAVLNALVDEIARLSRWDALSVTMFAEDRQGWVVQRVVNRSDRACVTEGTAVDLRGSIIGEVILSNRVEVVPDLVADDRPRFAPGEQFAREGTFVSIPVSSFSRCYGAVSLESASTSAFSGSDVELLYRLVENASAVLEVVYMNTMVREYASTEHLTGLTTRKFYLRQVEQEVLRAEDFSTELACITLEVDSLDEHVQRFGRDAADLILHDIAGIVRAHARPYDIAGREGPGRIGILLVHRTASDAYLWMEKVRKAVAGHVLSLDGRTFSVTASAGICGLAQGMTAAELLQGSLQVLTRAVESGGNVVRVY